MTWNSKDLRKYWGTATQTMSPSCLKSEILLEASHSAIPSAALRQSRAGAEEGLNRAALGRTREEIKAAERNLALATSPKNFRVIEGVLSELRDRSNL